MSTRRGQAYWDTHSGDEVVAKYWPYDGPHAADTVGEAASALVELVRYLNNATWNPRVLPHPDQVYRVLARVTSAVDSVTQTLEQLARNLEEASTRTGLYDDRRSSKYPAAQTAVAAAAAIHQAIGLLGSTRLDPNKGHLTRPSGVSQALHTATSAAVHLGMEG
jgi:hypothetical protein